MLAAMTQPGRLLVLNRWHPPIAAVAKPCTRSCRWTIQELSRPSCAHTAWETSVCHALTTEQLAPADDDKQREIAERIAANRQRRKDRVFLKCVACGIGVASPAAMHKHMKSCCPDLVDEAAWLKMLQGLPGRPTGPAPSDYLPLTSLMQSATQHEQQQRDSALHIAFRSGEKDSEGQLIRHGAEEIARRLNVPVPRASRLLSSAMRAVPLVADDIPLDILWECEHFLAVNKPAHVQTAPVHRFRGGSMVNRVLHHLQGRTPHVLHRLDMNTSGVLLFAKTNQVVAAVHKQFRQRTVQKMYVAVGEGLPAEDRWESHGAIGPHPDVKVARLVDCMVPGGVRVDQSPKSDTESESDGPVLWQTAHTSYVCVGRSPQATLASATQGAVYRGVPQQQGACLLAAAPHTGRTHQIRVHAQAAGHPLLGDELYGLQVPCMDRQALHAWRLSVKHPLTGQRLTFTAPLPADLLNLLRATGLEQHRLDLALDQAWSRLHA